MDKVSISSFESGENQIESYEMKGFDLVVKTSDGKSVIIENGLSELLINKSELPMSNGQKISFDSIMRDTPDLKLTFEGAQLEDIYKEAFEQKIGIDTGTETEQEENILKIQSEFEKQQKYLQELEKEVAEKNDELKDKQKKFEASALTKEELEQEEKELAEKQEELAKQIKKLKDQAEQQEESLENVEEGKINQEKTFTAEKLREEQQKENQTTNQVARKAVNIEEAPPISGSSTSSSDIQDIIEQFETMEAELFVTGGLDKESDSGNAEDGFTNINTPTFSGKTIGNSTVNLTINGSVYSILADADGSWSFELPSSLSDGLYEYQLSVKDHTGKIASVSGTVNIDTTVPALDSLEWKNNNQQQSQDENKTVESGGTSTAINDNTPQLSGISVAGAIITLEINGKTYRTVADENGKWTILITTPLIDGEFNYKLTAENKAGSITTNESLLIIDTVVETSYFYLDEASDTGIKNDFITNDSSPTFKGASEPNSTIKFFINGQVFTTQCDDEGNWTINLPDLPDGQYEIKIEITDTVGNKLEQSKDIIIDTTAPEINIGIKPPASSIDQESSTEQSQTYESTLNPNTLHTNQTTPIFIGVTEPYTTIEIIFNGVSYQCKADADGNWSLSLPQTLAEGIYSYQIIATDIAGNQSPLISDSLHIDLTPPSPPTAGLSEETNAGSLEDNITSVTTPILTGITEPFAFITVIIDGQTYQVQANDTGNWECEINALTDGEYHYEVSVKDQAGNQSASNTIGSIIIDTVVPVVNGGLIAPPEPEPEVDGEETSPEIANQETGGSTESDGTIVGGNDNEADPDPDGGGGIPGEGEGEGEGGGGESGEGELPEEPEDPEDPLFVNNGLANTGTPTFVGTALTGLTIIITINGESYTTVANEYGHWEYTLESELPQGEHEYTITSVSLSGAVSQPIKGTVTIDSVVISESGLADASDTGESQDDQITKDTRPDIVGTTEPNSKIILTFDGVEYEIIPDDQGNWSFSLPVDMPNLADGEYTYTLNITDPAGNTEDFEHKFVVDSAANITAGLDDSSKTDDNPNVTNDPRPILSGQAEVGAKVELTIGGEKYQATVGDDGKWRFLFSNNLSEGTHSYSVTILDLAGNTKTVNGSFQYVVAGSKPPTGSILLDVDTNSDSGILNDNITNISRPTFTGGCTAGSEAKLKLYLNGTWESYTLTLDPLGDFTFVLPEGIELPEGNVFYKLEISTPGTNLSTTVDGTFTIDTTKADFTFQLDTQHGGPEGDFYTRARTKNVFSGKTEPGAKIKITINGEDFETTAGHDGTWTLQVQDWLDEGSYPFTVTVTDRAGNESTATETLVISISIAQPTWDFADGQFTIGGGWCFDSLQPGIIINAPPGLDDPGLKVTITYAGVTITGKPGEIIRFPEGALNYNTFYASDLVFTISDSAGNSNSVTHNNVKTYVGNYSCNPTLASASDTGIKGDFVTKDPTPDFTGSFSIPNNSDASLTFSGYITINGVQYPLNIVKETNRITWTFTYPENAPPLVVGENDYTVTITDSYGGSSTTEGTVEVSFLDAWLPDESDTGNLAGDLTYITTPKIKGTGQPGAIIRLEINNKFYTTTVGEDGNWFIQIPDPLPDGYHKYSVTEQLGDHVDSFNNSLTIDTKVTMSCRLHPNNVGSDITVSKHANPTFYGYSEVGAKIKIEINGKIYQTSTNRNGYWQIWVANSLPDGDYKYKATVTDQAGNSSVVTGEITVAANLGFNLSQDNDHVVAPENWYYTDDGVLQGKGQPGTNMIIFLGSTNGKSITVPIDENGNWKIDASALFSDHSHGAQYTIILRSIHPVTGGYRTRTYYVKFDQTPPDAPTAELADQIELEGYENTTNLSKPTLTGTADPNATITITLNGVKYTTKAGAGGNWSFVFPDDLADGTHHYQIVVTDVNNRDSDIFHGSFNVDASPPDVVFEFDLDDNNDNGDNITTIRDQTFTGILKDGDTLVILINGVEHTPSIDGNGNWTLNLTDLVDGNYEYKIIITNPLGVQGIATGNFVIDTQILDPTTGLDVSSDSGTIGDNITTDSTPTLSGETEPGATINLIINGITYSTVADSNGHWSIQITTQLPLGAHQYTITATDLAGFVSNTVNGNFTVVEFDSNETVDVTASLVDGAGDSGNVSDSNFVTLAGTAPANAIIQVTLNGKVYNVNADATGNWTISIPHFLEDGSYDYIVNVVNLGNNIIGTTTGSINISSEIPFEILGFVEGLDIVESGYTADNTPSITGIGKPKSIIELTINGRTYQTTVGDDGKWTVNVSDLIEDGTYSYTVAIIDELGNSVVNTSFVTIDTQAPDGIIGGISSNDLIDGYINATESSTPSFNGITESGAVVTIVINGYSHTAVADSSGRWEIIFDPAHPPLTHGSHSYQIFVNDKAGNELSPPISGNIIVVLNNPSSESTLTDSSNTGSLDDNITSINQGITIEGKSAPDAFVTITFNGVEYKTTTDVHGNWKFSFPGTLANGTYDYSVTITDQFGKTSTSPGSFIVDTTATRSKRLLEEESDTNDNIDNPPVLNGVTEPNALLILAIAGHTYTLKANSDGSWSYKLPNLPIGEYPYSLIVNDEQGNETQANGTLEIGEKFLTTLITHSSVKETIQFEGVAQINSIIQLDFDGKMYDVQTNEFGEWMIEVEKPQSSGEYSYEIINSKDDEILATKIDNLEVTIQNTTEGYKESENIIVQQPMSAEEIESTLNELHEVQDIHFEGQLNENIDEIELHFNGINIDVEFSEDLTTWSANVPSKLILDENHYEITSINKDGSTSTVTDSFIPTEQFSSQTNVPTEQSYDIQSFDIQINFDDDTHDEY